MKKIILDTNFLLLPFTLKVDIFSEIDKIIHFPYEFVVLEQSLEELKNIINDKKEKGKNKDAAKMALKLIEQKIKKNEVKIVNFKKIKQKTLYKDIISKNLRKNVYVDDIILNEIIDYYIEKVKTGKDSREIEFIVATQDIELKKKLLKKGINVIYLRNKKKMEMQNVL